jgi:hypothetical protein
MSVNVVRGTELRRCCTGVPQFPMLRRYQRQWEVRDAVEASTLYSSTDHDPRNEFQGRLSRLLWGGGYVGGGIVVTGAKRKSDHCHRHIGTAGVEKSSAPRELFPRSLGGSRLQSRSALSQPPVAMLPAQALTCTTGPREYPTSLLDPWRSDMYVGRHVCRSENVGTQRRAGLAGCLPRWAEGQRGRMGSLKKQKVMMPRIPKSLSVCRSCV